MTPRAKERRFSRIRDIGCLCSRRKGWYVAPEVHHLNLGQHAGAPRRGDEFTIGLSAWHHRGVPLLGMNAKQCTQMLGPSMALEPVRFREVFGTDDELLAEQDRLIGEWDQVAAGVRYAP